METNLNIGIIGCGNISAIYLTNLGARGPGKVVAVADLDLEKARARAAEFGVPRVLTVDALLADPEVSLVLNLTVPAAHAEVSLSILRAGKSVYSEKPLALTVADGLTLLEEARIRGLSVGCAPDTFLGAGLSTGRKLIDDGWIGRPLGASARFLGGGPESWHPDPGFFYRPGAGPLWDMGPYYLTALIDLLGPVASLQAQARTTHRFRTVGSGPQRGAAIPVEVETHGEALLTMENGCLVNMAVSFDAPGGTGAPPLEVYGTQGTLQLPDPNTFGGPIRFRARTEDPWQEVPLLFPHAHNARGLGIPNRASGEVALHVVEVMAGWETSARAGEVVRTSHGCGRPAAR